MKGFHLTLDSWRPNCEKEGYRLPLHMMTAKDEEDKCVDPSEEARAPSLVAAVPRLKQDIEVLMKLTRSDTPIRHPMRPSEAAAVLIGFGDASGARFGGNEANRDTQYSSTLSLGHGHPWSRVSRQTSGN
jgi:hypothetical protein